MKKEIFGKLDAVRQARRDPRHQHLLSRRRRDRAATRRARSDVLGMHFFRPANVMRLLEIVRGEADRAGRARHRRCRSAKQDRQDAGRWSASATASSATACCAQRGIAGRALLLEGALPQRDRRAWYEFGFPMGPFAMSDLAGLDIGWRIAQGARRNVAPSRRRALRAGPLRPEDRRGLLQLRRAARARRSPIPRSSSSSSTTSTEARHHAAAPIADQEIVERLHATR